MKALNSKDIEARFRVKLSDLSFKILQRVIYDENGCWVWTGGKTLGYGSLGLRIPDTDSWTSVLTHRVMYEAKNGPISPGLELDHLCRNRACCNPDHLEPVTHAENLRRANSKTHCKRGHPFDEANTRHFFRRAENGAVRPARECLACVKERNAARPWGHWKKYRERDKLLRAAASVVAPGEGTCEPKNGHDDGGTP